MGEFIPRNHVIDFEKRKIINRKTGEEFVFKNRSFKEINHSYRDLPVRLIRSYSELTAPQPVRVLDVAGGFYARAATDIAQKFGSAVRVVSSDVLANSDSKLPNSSMLSADAFSLPFADESFHLIYSKQFLFYLQEMQGYEYEQAHNYPRTRNVLKEMTRVLKKGGVLLTDDEKFSRLKENDTRLQELSRELGVTITVKSTGFYGMSPLERYAKLLGSPWYVHHGGLLVIQKGKLPDSVKQIIDNVPFGLKRWQTK